MLGILNLLSGRAIEHSLVLPLYFQMRLSFDRMLSFYFMHIMVYWHVTSRQDNLKEEEKLKKELRLRMAYAGFLQETVTAMAVKKKTRYTEKHATICWQRSFETRCFRGGGSWFCTNPELVHQKRK